MATAVLCYEVKPGEYRGVHIRRMGDSVALRLSELFGPDRDALVEFIETGITRGGYNYPGTVSFWNILPHDGVPGGYTTNAELVAAGVDYTWLLQTDGTIVAAKVSATGAQAQLPVAVALL